MTVWQLILHLFNFVLPALAMAAFMPWAGRWVLRSSRAMPVRRRMAVHAICGVTVLVGGLLVQGQDGKNGHLRRSVTGGRQRRMGHASGLEANLNLPAVLRSSTGYKK